MTSRTFPLARAMWLSVGTVALTAFSLVSAAHAELVLSNLGQYTPGGYQSAVRYGEWTGSSFTTNNQAWNLTSATLYFGSASNTSGNMFVEVRGNSANKPGSLLGTLSGTANPATLGQYTFTTTGIDLAPSTTFWLVAGVSSGAGYYTWQYDNTGSPPLTSSGVWSLPTTNTYTSSSNQGTSWTNGDAYPQLFSLEATSAPVPEIDPAGIGSVLALVTGALGLLERRRLKVA